MNDNWGIPKPKEFTMRADHDSCWRTDGMRDIRTACGDMWNKLRERNPEASISEFSVIHDVRWVEVTHVFSDSRCSYRKKLIHITPGQTLKGR